MTPLQPPGLPSHNTRTALLSAGFGLAEEEAPVREPDGPAAARESGTGPQGSRACDRVQPCGPLKDAGLFHHAAGEPDIA